MTSPRLSIGIPSNRPLAESRHAIESAVNLCRHHGYELVVFDNSGSDEKAAALEKIVNGDNLHFIKSEPCDFMRNWFQTFHRTTGKYVMMMGDDDSVFAYQDAPDFSNLAPDVVGVRPAVMGYAANGGILRVNISHIGGEIASQRILEHMQSSNGANLGIFTFWRRDIFQSVMDLWHDAHPTRGPYCDWSWMNAFVSSGRVAHDPSVCYFYNLQNWSGSAENVGAQVERAYIKGGLPEGTSIYEPILGALDSYIFIARQDSPLDAQEKFLTAVFVMDMYIRRWLDSPQLGPHANAAAINATLEKLRNLDSIPGIFDVLAEALEAIKPGLAAAYRDFHRKATGLEWGVFGAELA